jgi:hypothetical protein
MRCLRGVSASDAVALFGTKNELSASCDEAVYRRSRFEAFRTSTEFSSSDDVAYRARVAFLGLDRVALIALGGINMVGSFGLGFRRRAMLAMRNSQETY